MIAKKSKKASLENKRLGIFLLGIVSAAAFALAAFEWKDIVELKDEKGLAKTEEKVDLDDIPEIKFMKPQPAPARPQPKKRSNNYEETQKEIPEIVDADPNKKEDVIIPDDGLNRKDFGGSGNGPIIKGPGVFTIVEKMPEYPGGLKAMYKYLSKHVKYPPMAREAGIEGTVTLSFIINEDGQINDIKVLRDIGGGCGAEAVRVVKNMPAWSPGEQRGKKVKVRFTLPINFELD